MAPPSKDIKTQGIVLRRTNYGEADRILNIITPLGKFGVMARGVRKPRSKLAGGVEMLTLSDLQIHQGRSELGVLTGARMIKHYGEIMKDYGKMQLVGVMLKKVGMVAETVNNAEFFEVLVQVLEELNSGGNVILVEVWFWLNIMRASGEEMNFYRDSDGEGLVADERYNWDAYQGVFVKHQDGRYGENEIKLLRLILKVNLRTLRRIKIEQDVMDKVYDIIRLWEN